MTPDNTLTVAFIDRLQDATHPAGANVTLFPRVPVPLPGGGTATLGNRYFVFIDVDIAQNVGALAHELHHVVFNRGDAAVPAQFFTFNTNGPAPPGIDDVRTFRRIQNLHAPDPDNDPAANGTLNWYRRVRTARFAVVSGPAPPAAATTGNTLVTPFTP